jgi:hypothetical protein
MRLTLVPAIAGVLLVAACASGEAASSSQPEHRAELKTMRGYNCTQAAIAGRYSCARSLERQAQRQAADHAPADCHSCGNVLSK